ncbi:MAG: Hpt domain-containing protein [Chloroflexota bacterium]
MDKEILAGFIEEAQGYLPEISQGLTTYAADQRRLDALEIVHRHTHTIKGAAAMVGLDELSQVAAQLEAMFELMGAELILFDDDLLTFLTETFSGLKAYLATVLDYPDVEFPNLNPIKATFEAYQTQSQMNGQPSVVDDANLESSNLMTTDFAIPNEIDAVQDQARIEPQPQPLVEQTETTEVSVAHNEEVLVELMEVFALEAEDHIQSINQSLNILMTNPDDREALQEVRRRVHTIKGSAGIIGLQAIAQLAHRMEDMLDQLFDGQLAISEEIMAILYPSADLLEDLMTGTTPPDVVEIQLETLYQQYEAILPSDRNEEVITTTDMIADTDSFSMNEAETLLAEATARGATVDPDQLAIGTASLAAPFSVLPKLNEAGLRQSGEVVRVPINHLDELVNLVSELVISNTSFEQRLQDFNREVAELEPSIDRLRQTSSTLESQYEAQSLGKDSALAGISDPDAPLGLITSNGVLLNNEDYGFDELEFDRYTEFHLMTRGLAETTNDVRTVGSELRSLIGEFDGVLNRQGRLVNELQQKVMQVRMVPLSTLTTRLRRAVRVVAQQRDKRVDLVIEGEHIALDKTVLEEIADPLLHILRNAVDHGIEPSLTRESMNKEPQGKIHLQAYYEGNQVVIQVADDGVGLDLENIRAQAVNIGLVTQAEAEQLTPKMLEEVIFLPGFSTAKEVNEVSGRGVGMDIVRANVNKLKGSLTLESTLNKGTTFTIRLPMTLAITQALLIRAGDEIFAMPQEAVSQILRLTDDAFEKFGQETVFQFGEEIFPVVWLRQALNINQASDISPERFPVLLTKSEGQPIALVVDELLEGRDIVVKSLGDHLHRVPGVAGATLMGDGSVVLILNPNELYLGDDAFADDEEPDMQLEQADFLSLPEANQPKPLSIMVVDDSVSVRRVVSNMIRDIGWLPVVARDGLEALETIQRSTVLPDLILLDIEMPRMDGYELTNTLRRQEEYQYIPIVMLTSRAGEKHRQKAYEVGVSEYMVKPYQESELIKVIRSLTHTEHLAPSWSYE